MLISVRSRWFGWLCAAACWPLLTLACAGAGATRSNAQSGIGAAGSAENAGTKFSCPSVKSTPPPPLLKCAFAADGTNPAIDDFNDRDLLIAGAEGRSGRWYSYTDESNGCLDMQIGQDAASPALHVSGGGFSKWGSGFGVSLAWSEEEGGLCSYDLSKYSGIQFKAHGNTSLRLSVRTSASIFQSAGGNCPDSERCFDEFGKSVALSAEEKQYQIPFCALAQRGWGVPLGTFDASRATGLNFLVETKGAFDVWLEDVEFMPRTDATAGTCQSTCPRDELPAGIQPKPSATAVNPRTSGVQLFTFEQPTPNCGPVIRRYLAYKPKTLNGSTSAPVIIVLHGHGADAEVMRSYMTQTRFERLADRDGFVVVYGNAAPGSGTVRERPNGGAFRTENVAAQQVDELAYLRQIITDLTARGLINGKGPVFLAGLSNGGGLAHLAALKDSARYQGIAEVMPYAGYQVELPQPAGGYGLKRFLLAFTQNDPGLPAQYHTQLQPLGEAWAAALGLTQSGNVPTRTPLGSSVLEGATYTGSNALTLATRNSHATQLDYGNDVQGPLVRVLEFDRAGHFWPVAKPSLDDASTVAQYGLRNQDLDMSDAIWEFFRSSLRP